VAPPDHGSTDAALPILPLRMAMRHTGLSARQIRHYESLGLIRPTRTRGNQRLYSEKDLERLSLIKELLGRGLSLEGIRQILLPGEAAFSMEAASSEEGPARQEEVTARFCSGQRGDHGKIPVTGRLTSLYPVSHPKELLELLQAIRERAGK